MTWQTMRALQKKKKKRKKNQKNVGKKSPAPYLIIFNWTALLAWINQELKWLFHCSNMTEQGIHMHLPFEGFVVEVVFCAGFEGGEGNNSADGDWKIFLSCLKYNMKWTMKLTSHNSLQRSAGLNWFHVLATKYSWCKMDYVEKKSDTALSIIKFISNICFNSRIINITLTE